MSFLKTLFVGDKNPNQPAQTQRKRDTPGTPSATRPVVKQPGWEPIFADDRRTVAGIWFADDFTWFERDQLLGRITMKGVHGVSHMESVLWYLLKERGAPIDFAAAFDLAGNRFIRNTFDSRGGSFVMFRGHLAPGEGNAKGPPASPSTPVMQERHPVSGISVHPAGKCASCGKDMKKGEGLVAGLGPSMLAHLSDRPFLCKSCGTSICGECGLKIEWVCPRCSGRIGD